MPRFTKIIASGILLGVLGIIAGISPPGLYLEENVGLTLLFRLRGVRKPPPDVLIVDLDTSSANKLNLDHKTKKWPYQLHARLIERLVEAEASVIAFDLFFDRSSTPAHDRLFAETIKNARNVVLFESLTKNSIRLGGDSDASESKLNIEQLIPPIPVLAKSAIALAPFPLPRVPVKVSRFWLFKETAGGSPTLPVAAFQIYCLRYYDTFVFTANNAAPHLPEHLPKSLVDIYREGDVIPLIRSLRKVFKDDPDIRFRVLSEISSLAKTADGTAINAVLGSLVKMYCGSDSNYLNFYGPAGTITTVPYQNMLQGTGPVIYGSKEIDLKGKAVFVGVAERDPVNPEDSFYTVFTQANGIDLSGVEIAATAFANLMEGKTIQPLPLRSYIFFILAAGIFMGALCLILPSVFFLVFIFGTGSLYLFYAQYQFENHALWYPLSVPLLIQAPVAFFGAALWKYYSVDKERKNIRKAFGFYIPCTMVDRLAKETGSIKDHCETMHGTCLCSDGEQYATLSEKLPPPELLYFLNQYYESVFHPVKEHGGLVTDIIGDCMLAIWTGVDLDVSPRIDACTAALKIQGSVCEFNCSFGKFQLPTRIGMHSGCISLGNVGGADHFEYRPVGDVVNTAARLESLNKYFDTKILVSREVLVGIDSFLARKIGKFLLAGKSKPVTIYELICHIENSTQKQKDFCEIFARALEAYAKQSWEEAAGKFFKAISIIPSDGPSRFYLELCKKFKSDPPGDGWEGYVRISAK